MDIFNFDAVTGEFLGSSKADESPLEPGQYLIPANATLVPPLAPKEGFVRRFNDGAWGYSPKGDVEAPPTEEPLINTAMVDAERDRRIDAGFTFEMIHFQLDDGSGEHIAGTKSLATTVLFQSDEGSRENIAGAKSLATDAISLGAQAGDYSWQRLLDEDGPETFVWIASDNSLHPMDAQTMVRFGYAALRHKQGMIFKARDLKAMDPIPDDYATNETYWSQS